MGLNHEETKALTIAAARFIAATRVFYHQKKSFEDILANYVKFDFALYRESGGFFEIAKEEDDSVSLAECLCIILEKGHLSLADFRKLANQ